MKSMTRYFWQWAQNVLLFFSFPMINGQGNVVINAPKNFRTRIKIIGNNNHVRFGRNFKTKWLEIDIKGNNTELVIGDDCKITGTLKIKGQENTLRIGNKTTAQDVYMIAEESCSLSIGDDCMISADVLIRTTDAHSIIDRETGERKNPAQSITIGDHIWLGMGVVIAPGASIAHHCVVATRAIVTKPFDTPHCTIGGVPAKILSENIDWNRKRL